MDPTDERALAADQGHATFSIQRWVETHGDFIDLSEPKGDNSTVGMFSPSVRNRKDPLAALQFPVEMPVTRW